MQVLLDNDYTTAGSGGGDTTCLGGGGGSQCLANKVVFIIAGVGMGDTRGRLFLDGCTRLR